MNCPSCQTTLQLAERQGVEIDYCPKCRGVWLDRGELDKILDRAAQAAALDYPSGADPRAERRRGQPERHVEDADWRYADREDRYRRGRRNSFLSELFDFD